MTNLINARKQDRITAALASFEAGFTTKAAQKEAMAALNAGWSCINGAHHTWAIAKADAEFAHIDWATEQRAEIYRARGDAIYAAHDLPFDLHNVRAKHMTQLADIDAVAVTEYLIELRAAFKAAEVVRVERPANEVKVAAIRESILGKMERLGARYVEALEMGERFGGLPVHVNAHWVVNEHGTQFMRHFFYLNGKLTPLNLIIAAAEELERRKGA